MMKHILETRRVR